MASIIAHWVETTPADKLGWQAPGEGEAKGRSVYDMLVEISNVNRSFAARLNGVEPASGEGKTYSSPEEAMRDLQDSAKELANAVRSQSDDVLTKHFDLWNTQVPGEILITLPMDNMIYHGGQINMVQILCGDAEFHIPPAFLG